MEATPDNKLLIVQDPLSKRLTTNRTWAGVAILIALCLGYSAFAPSTANSNTTLIICKLAACISIIVASISIPLGQTRYWQRIGQRRYKILHGKQDKQNIQPFLASDQIRPEKNALEIPAKIRLTWSISPSSSILILIVIAMIIAILSGSILILNRLVQNYTSFDYMLTFFIILVAMLIVFIACIISFLYYPQSIEITEEGIKTRYSRQERFIRWADARVFASYGAQGASKSPLVKTYELSNDQVIVRWSQYAQTSVPLKVESTIDAQEDWNWQVRRINAYVATRTGLPLLDLSDDYQPPSPISTATTKADPLPQSAEPGEHVTSDDAPTQAASVKIAQDKNVMGNTPAQRKRTWLVMSIITGALLLVLLVTGYQKFSPTGTAQPVVLDPIIINFLFWLSSFFTILLILVIWAVWLMVKNQSRIQAKRQQAILQPKRFQLAEQPTPTTEQPQPERVKLARRKRTIFLVMFMMFFVGWFFIHLAADSEALTFRNIIATLIGACFFAVLMSLLQLLLVNNVPKTYIEIDSEGIATRTGTVETYIRWQDARLFARYKSPLGLTPKRSRSWQYELTGEETIVRWQWPRSRRWQIVVEPAMTQDEYDRWLDELQRYVVARTNLPLLDFDAS